MYSQRIFLHEKQVQFRDFLRSSGQKTGMKLMQTVLCCEVFDIMTDEFLTTALTIITFLFKISHLESTSKTLHCALQY